jgi:hypothetical protein
LCEKADHCEQDFDDLPIVTFASPTHTKSFYEYSDVYNGKDWKKPLCTTIPTIAAPTSIIIHAESGASKLENSRACLLRDPST